MAMDFHKYELEETNMTKSGKIRAAIAIVLVVLMAIANVGLNMGKLVLDKVFGTVSYSRDEEDVDKAIEESREVALKVEEEGIVLLQNDGDYLPVAGLDRVNLFGWGSYSPISCMVGSAAVNNDEEQKISITAAFERAGIEYNKDIEKMYDGLGFSGSSSTRAGNADYHLYEAGKDEIDGVMEGAKEFSDVAVITLGRAAGESTDVPLYMDEYDEVDGQSLGVAGRHYLELSEREKYLVSTVCENFENVIVLLNNANVMELGYLEQFEQIRSILSIGIPGDYGFAAVAEVLKGEVNPSGRTVDTYAYDLLATPAAQIPHYNTFGNYKLDDKTVYWVTYNEGIYVGYRYYETRYVGDDNVYSEAEEAEYWQNVKYPFGYGMSYTDFEWEVVGQKLGESGGTIEVEVKVTNVGGVAGKDVVELYYTAPYEPGGVEKAFVSLGAFAKTGLIEPGESDTVVLQMNVDDMVSYDYRGEGCYVLEKGEYLLKLQTDAHREKDGVEQIRYVVEEDVVYKEEMDGARSTDLQAAVNHFENTGIEMMSAKEDASASYLSRHDWEGTWPDLAEKYEEIAEKYAPVFGNEFERTYKGYTAEASPELMKALDAGWWEDYDPAADYRNTYFENEAVVPGTPYYLKEFPYADEGDEDYETRIAVNDTVKLADMAAVDYTDKEVWEKFICQMGFEEMMRLYQDGGYMTAAIDSIGKSAGVDLDGPAGVSDYMSLKNNYSVCWPSAVVVAQTWNVDLAHEMGVAFGTEALAEGCTGLYAPAVNVHRSPFGGRNGEYPSEDGLLAGKIFASEVRGLRETKISVYVKHFALNNQETVRDVNGLCTFANEQTIREIYLKPFELCVKEGGANGLMNAYNRIGAEWCGMCPALQMDVTRGEWGFEGNIVTDFFIVGSWADNGYMSVQMALKSGTDLLLTGDGYEVDNPNYLQMNEVEEDVYTQQALKQVCKNICFAQSRGSMMEIEHGYGWRKIWLAGNLVLGAVILVLVAGIILDIRKRKK